jgi:hypothetical protein
METTGYKRCHTEGRKIVGGNRRSFGKTEIDGEAHC